MHTDKHRLEKQKAALRSEIQAKLKTISLEKQKSDSEKLCAILKGQSFFQSPASVLFFASLSTEPDLWPLLEESFAAGKIVALPRFNPASQSYIACRVQNLQDEIISGRFSIREPHKDCVEITSREIDLVLVPGIAFDLQGRRLGRGNGFYDRLLEKFRGLKIGVAFDEQIVDEVPKESHDIWMDFILTPTRCLEMPTGKTIRAAGS